MGQQCGLFTWCGVGAVWTVHMVWSWSSVDCSHGVELEKCGLFTWCGVGAVWIIHMVWSWCSVDCSHGVALDTMTITQCQLCTGGFIVLYFLFSPLPLLHFSSSSSFDILNFMFSCKLTSHAHCRCGHCSNSGTTVMA